MGNLYTGQAAPRTWEHGERDPQAWMSGGYGMVLDTAAVSRRRWWCCMILITLTEQGSLQFLLPCMFCTTVRYAQRPCDVIMPNAPHDPLPKRLNTVLVMASSRAIGPNPTPPSPSPEGLPRPDINSKTTQTQNMLMLNNASSPLLVITCSCADGLVVPDHLQTPGPLGLAHLAHALRELLPRPLVLRPRPRRDLHPGHETGRNRHCLERRPSRWPTVSPVVALRRRQRLAAAEDFSADLFQFPKLCLVATKMSVYSQGRPGERCMEGALTMRVQRQAQAGGTSWHTLNRRAC